MQTEKLEISQVHYNPERSAFEAIVRIHDGNEVFSYPSYIVAALNADFATVSRGLTEMAEKLHGSKTPGLRLRSTKAVGDAFDPIFEKLAA